MNTKVFLVTNQKKNLQTINYAIQQLFCRYKSVFIVTKESLINKFIKKAPSLNKKVTKTYQTYIHRINKLNLL